MNCASGSTGVAVQGSLQVAQEDPLDGVTAIRRAPIGQRHHRHTQSLDAHKGHCERRHRAKTLWIFSSTYVVKKKQLQWTGCVASLL